MQRGSTEGHSVDNQPNQNSELNQFLNNLDASLSGMSANRRSQELKEMRLHIEEIATQLEGNGLEPALALQNAVRQMGDPNSIGEKLTEEWRLTSDGRRRILIGGIVRAGVFGALASVFCSDIRSIFSNVAFFSHGHIIARASQFAIAEDLVVDLLTLCCLCAILISGAILASAIPRTSTPMSIIPAAIYASIIFDVTQTLLLPRFIPSFPWNSLLPLVSPVFNS